MLNRGSKPCAKGIHQIVCDRKNMADLYEKTSGKSWDVIFDQVLMDADDAAGAKDVLIPRTGRYIMTSSQSVYSMGKSLSESNFDPLKHSFSKTVTTKADYAEAKRQAESVLAQVNEIPVAFVRFPIVLGIDDYTRRLHYHVERALNNEPVYFPDIDAKISLISSKDAASCLEALLDVEHQGPLNMASAVPVQLKKIIEEIEAATGRTVNLADKASKENHSPFGVESDWYMSVERMDELGIKCAEAWSWLRPLIRELVDSKVGAT